MSHYLVTGTAGFIGARTSQMLIEQGHTVVGIDNMNDAYDPRMKDYRLRNSRPWRVLLFINMIFRKNLPFTFSRTKNLMGSLNLAARAGCALQRGESLGVFGIKCYRDVEHA